VEFTLYVGFMLLVRPGFLPLRRHWV